MDPVFFDHLVLISLKLWVHCWVSLFRWQMGEERVEEWHLLGHLNLWSVYFTSAHVLSAGTSGMTIMHRRLGNTFPGWANTSQQSINISQLISTFKKHGSLVDYSLSPPQFISLATKYTCIPFSLTHRISNSRGDQPQIKPSCFILFRVQDLSIQIWYLYGLSVTKIIIIKSMTKSNGQFVMMPGF